MVKKRSEKEQNVATLNQELEKVKTVILSSFEGLTVAQDTELRRAIQASGGKYRVVKNTLAELAAKGTPAEPVLKNLAGTTSIAYTDRDPVALAKVLTKYAKEYPALKFRMGLVEGRVVSLNEIQQLATIPGREELLSKIMFLLNAPAQRLASALAALPRNVAATVNQAVNENKFVS